MSKADGMKIGIQFTEELFGYISGNENAFTVTGKEYKYVNGIDNNGAIIDRTYEVESVEPHPTVDRAILLNIVDYQKFNNVLGSLTVEYDMTKGRLVGRGGRVESFMVEFTPVDLIGKPNPGHAESLSATPGSNTIEFKSIVYTSLFDNKDCISAMPGQSIIDFKEAGIINP